MKFFNHPVRIINDTTLENVGTYEPNQVCVLKSNEFILNIKEHKTTWFVMAIIIIGLFVMTCGMINSHYATAHINKQLIGHIDSLEYERVAHALPFETLVGLYATSRTPVPADMDEVYKVCIQSGSWYPEIIMAQFILESSSGTSSLSKSARNFYGMKYINSKGRPTLQIPGVDVNGYGVYVNWQHSVLDRVLWDDYVFKSNKPSKTDYMNKVGRIYAEDPNYISKVTKIASLWESKTDSIIHVMSHQR